jgi:two-component system chemotaxis response regulator CheV
VTELAGDRLVMMLDVEKVLSETTTQDDQYLFKGIEPIADVKYTVFFADDSSVARKQIERTLEVLGVPYVGSINGRMAWEELQKVARHAQATGRQVNELVSLVLTDVEMPEMDG